MTTGTLSASDRAAFRSNVLRVAKLDEADLAAIEAYARVRSVTARTELLSCGQRAVESGMVVLGLVREYYPLADGGEVTRSFGGPGDYVGSLSDLLTGLPAKSTTVAEADTRLVVVPWQKMVELAAQRPAWAAFSRRITEQLYLAKAAREYELLALDAEARYVRFRQRYAAIEPLIALRHVASYVGVTPEHLSRLRRRLGIAAAGSSARRAAPRRAKRAGPASRR